MQAGPGDLEEIRGIIERLDTATLAGDQRAADRPPAERPGRGAGGHAAVGPVRRTSCRRVRASCSRGGRRLRRRFPFGGGPFGARPAQPGAAAAAGRRPARPGARRRRRAATLGSAGTNTTKTRLAAVPASPGKDGHVRVRATWKTSTSRRTSGRNSLLISAPQQTPGAPRRGDQAASTRRAPPGRR